jgi:hypothetical protein
LDELIEKKSSKRLRFEVEFEVRVHSSTSVSTRLKQNFQQESLKFAAEILQMR